MRTYPPYPPPNRTVDHEVIGRTLIVPIDLYEEDGFRVSVEDFYEAVCVKRGDGSHDWAWRFTERVRQWTPAYHQGDDTCDVCIARSHKWPNGRPSERLETL